ncbi:MAG: hypothetical protein PHO74_06485 [Weeksellaceae bacterium]|nr:hypothetical protein [Weeksellaceae bacterium]
MRFALLILLCAILGISCNKTKEIPVTEPVEFDQIEYARQLKESSENPKNKASSGQSLPISPKKDSSVHEKEISLLTEPPSDTIQLKINWGRAKSDTSKLARQKMVFEFDSDTASNMRLKVSPEDSLSNLRISQIIDPLGNSEGPFGRETTYPISERGIYSIVVSESLMNGEPYSGKFLFEVQLGW